MTTQDPGLNVAALRALLDRKPLLTRTEALPLIDRLQAAEEALTQLAEQLRIAKACWKVDMRAARTAEGVVEAVRNVPTHHKVQLDGVRREIVYADDLRAAIEGPTP